MPTVRKLIVILAGLVGLLVLGGSAFALLHRSGEPSATTQLYLVQPSGAPASEEMANDLALLQTSGLARAVAAALPPSLKGTKGSFKGLAVTSNVMAITAKESSRAGAVTLAETAANQFLQARKEELTKATDAQVAGLQQQIDADQVTAQSLYSTIAKASQGERSAVFNQWTADSTTIHDLQNMLAQAEGEPTTETSPQGSYVLEAAALSPSKTKL